MDAITLLRDQLKSAYRFLEWTMADVTPEQMVWIPPGRANPLGAIYAHALIALDDTVNNLLKKDRPLFASSWAGRTGINDPLVLIDHGRALAIQVDLPTAREYGKAVYESADAYLATLSPEMLESSVDLSAIALGTQTLAFTINRILIAHLDNMTGEASCLKGLQGAKGYPV